jgi:hypothetical protein
MDARRPHRLTIVAAGLCLALLQTAAGFAATPPTPPAAAPVVNAAAPATGTPAGEPAAGDAAAKHAKRTACLKDAKTKKLVGAEKNAYVMNCISAPRTTQTSS